MLKLDKICVSFRSERQDKIFGHTKQQILFDVSVEVKKGPVWEFLANQEVVSPRWDVFYAVF